MRSASLVELSVCARIDSKASHIQFRKGLLGTSASFFLKSVILVFNLLQGIVRFGYQYFSTSFLYDFASCNTSVVVSDVLAIICSRTYVSSV